MNIKKVNIIGFAILFLLLIIAILIAYNYFGPGAGDIKASKQFISKLYSINAINTEHDLKSIKYERSRVANTKSNLLHKTIVTQSYGIDLDKNNNIIGFAKKETPKNETKLNLKMARDIAENYLKNICGNVMMKTVKSDEKSESLPYYTFIYTKEKDGYPFYFDEIKININKETGFLDGYSNSTIQRVTKEPVINYSKEEAEKIALDEFEKYNKDGEISDETNLIYADNKIEEKSSSVYEVCYIVPIIGKDSKDNHIKWKLLISAENGILINTLKDGLENEVKTD